VLNATAAIAVGTALDIPAEQIRSALDDFRGVDRRFQFKGKSGGVSVIDDYGHHPTEIRATLAAARQCGFRRVHVIFQPHRFTRTRDLMDQFATAFADADTLCLLDIYPASEKPIEGITAEVLAGRIAGGGSVSVTYAPSFSDAVAAVAALAQPGDMVLTLGAGSVSQLGAMILEKLDAKAAQASAPRT
jgi:UDP-N-acetylmuramate--alanine ligase